LNGWFFLRTRALAELVPVDVEDLNRVVPVHFAGDGGLNVKLDHDREPEFEVVNQLQPQAVRRVSGQHPVRKSKGKRK